MKHRQRELLWVGISVSSLMLVVIGLAVWMTRPSKPDRRQRSGPNPTTSYSSPERSQPAPSPADSNPPEAEPLATLPPRPTPGPPEPTPAAAEHPALWFRNSEGHVIPYSPAQIEAIAAARRHVDTAEKSGESSPPIIHIPQELLAERKANSETTPRLLFFGDSLTERNRYRLYRNIIDNRFGTWSELGFKYLTMTGGVSSTERDIWPTSPIKLLKASAPNIKVSRDTTIDLDFDEATVYYVAEAGAGTFEIQIGPNAGPFITHGEPINADNGSAPALGIARVMVPRGLHSLNYTHTRGGTVKIITSRVRKTSGGGLGLFLMSEGGRGVTHWNKSNPTFIQGILADTNLHLVVFQAADNLTTELPKLQKTIIDVYTPRSLRQPHWLLLSRNTWGTNNPSSVTGQAKQAAYLRNIAVTGGHSFLDIKPAFGNQPMAEGLTGPNDDVHATEPAGALAALNFLFDHLSYLPRTDHPERSPP